MLSIINKQKKIKNQIKNKKNFNGILLQYANEIKSTHQKYINSAEEVAFAYFLLFFLDLVRLFLRTPPDDTYCKKINIVRNIRLSK